MAIYLYNGVELPALPEWDKETYPYAFISNEIFNRVTFYALAQRPYSNGTETTKGTICNPYETDILLVQSSLRADSNTWGDLTEAHLGPAGQISLPFWANFDVINEDNTLCLAASNPVPKTWVFCLKSWLIGFALGIAGKPLPLKRKASEIDAVLVDGVLYVRNAPAVLNDSILEVR